MKREPNENAFPCHQGQDFSVREWGLTKREYFAALAMQGYLASVLIDTIERPEYAASYAVKYADALIKELNKDQ